MILFLGTKLSDNRGKTLASINTLKKEVKFLSSAPSDKLIMLNNKRFNDLLSQAVDEDGYQLKEGIYE